MAAPSSNKNKPRRNAAKKATPKSRDQKRAPKRKIDARKEEDIQRSLSFHSSKLAWLGEMAGGVAHEINNPLAVIHGHTNLLREDALRGRLSAEKVLRSTEKIEAMVLRINRIVISLKEMASDSEGMPFQKTALKPLIEKTSQLFHVARDEQSSIEVGAISDTLTIDCRSTQISQVLMHLILNAKEAIRDKTDKWVRIEAEDSGDFVKIRVIDSGPGVTPTLRERIFDPFVTTGRAGRSSGLGLTIARRICELHGGSLRLEKDTPNTTFSLTLPKCQTKLEESMSSISLQGDIRKSTEIEL